MVGDKDGLVEGCELSLGAVEGDSLTEGSFVTASLGGNVNSGSSD